MPSTVYYNDRSFKKGSEIADHDSFRTALQKKEPIQKTKNKNNKTTLKQIFTQKGNIKMKTKNFKSFRELSPVVKVFYIIALIAAVAGMVMLVLEMLGVLSTKTWLPLSAIVTSLWISIYCLCRCNNKKDQ